MNAQDLKNSILQLAVQGKLVEQRPEEGSAKELLEQIKAEKERLIKEKKIKKEKPLPEITEAEKPFEIPESWEWVRLGNIGVLIRGSGIKRTETLESGYPCIRYGELYTTYKTKFNNVMSFVDKKLYDKSHKITKGDIAMTLTGENKTDIAIAVTYDGVEEIAMGGDMTCWSHHLMEPLYLVYLMNSPYAISCKRRLATGDIIIHISNDKLASIPLPMPPLAEQKRIVSKIEEILPYIEQYDKAYTKLEIFNKKFPTDMKKSILQLAMQGKLVEQRPEEGMAEELYQQIAAEKARLIKEGKIKKEKSLDEITEDEIPFDIPESWKWVRLNDLCEKIGSGSTPTGGKNVYKESGIKFLRSQNIYNDGLRYEGVVYISEAQNRQSSIVKAKDILLNITGGSIGRCAIVPDDFDIANINQHVMIIRNVNLEVRYWIHAVIISAYIQNKIMDVQVGVSREGLSAEKLKNFLIPLPPLDEQKRIVAKLEEMLSYCEQLIK